MEKQIEQCDAAITELIAADEKLQAKAQRLDAIPGMGAVTAATVLAELPELGTISNEAAAALVGVAPYNRDSGAVQGVPHIAGGRTAVRCALYMAAMRKLVVLMNRLLKNPNFQLAN